MSDLNDAITHTKTFAERFKGIVDLIPHLERFAATENATRELEQRLAQIGAETAAAKTQLADAKAAAERASGEADRIMQEAQMRASTLMERTQADAAAERDRLLAEARAEVQKVMSQKGQIEEQTARAQVEREAALERLAATKDELAAVQAKITAARDSVKSLFAK